MIYPLIGARLHGWLDELVVLTYLIGGFLLRLRGMAMWTVLVAAAVHFFLVRFTNYPQGLVRKLPFRAHAFIELAEGLFVIASTLWLIPADTPTSARAFLLILGASQLVAFSFSDYRWPLPGESEKAS